MSDLMERSADTRPAFGAWLLRQRTRDGLIGDLARAAEKDRRFPRAGGIDEVRKHLGTMQADHDAWTGFEDAESDWLCL